MLIFGGLLDCLNTKVNDTSIDDTFAHSQEAVEKLIIWRCFFMGKIKTKTC